jgi:hypothetical protein
MRQEKEMQGIKIRGKLKLFLFAHDIILLIESPIDCNQKNCYNLQEKNTVKS